MKFKKSIALLVAFLMLVSNAGFAMTVHYCGGKISSISSGFGNNKTCKKPQPEAEKTCCARKVSAHHKKCCSEKTVNRKAKAIDVIVKMASVNYTLPFVLPANKPVAFADVVWLDAENSPTYYCDAHAPPLFKLYKQYIFYA